MSKDKLELIRTKVAGATKYLEGLDQYGLDSKKLQSELSSFVGNIDADAFLRDLGRLTTGLKNPVNGVVITPEQIEECFDKYIRGGFNLGRSSNNNANSNTNTRESGDNPANTTRQTSRSNSAVSGGNGDNPQRTGGSPGGSGAASNPASGILSGEDFVFGDDTEGGSGSVVLTTLKNVGATVRDSAIVQDLKEHAGLAAATLAGVAATSYGLYRLGKKITSGKESDEVSEYDEHVYFESGFPRVTLSNVSDYFRKSLTPMPTRERIYARLLNESNVDPANAAMQEGFVGTVGEDVTESLMFEIRQEDLSERCKVYYNTRLKRWLSL